MVNAAESTSSAGPEVDEAVLLVSTMVAAEDESFQHTIAELKAKTSKAVRTEMLDRILDGAAILPSSTYQHFVVLLPQNSVADSLRSLLPFVTPALSPSSAGKSASSARIQVKGLEQAEVAANVITVLKNAGYREANIQGSEVLATAPVRMIALPLRRKKDPAAIARKAALWSIVDHNSAITPTIDESSLLTAEDLKRASAVQRPDCDVKKTRKACKNCTCGLREILLEEKDDLPPALASNGNSNGASIHTGRAMSGVDRQLPNGERKNDVQVVTTGAVTSSCGNCYLGDAFRCDSCPYIGLPAFEPGQKVQISAGMMDDDY